MIPVIMAINFTIIYWVDKTLLLRFYKTPKNFDETIISYTISKLKATFTIHGVMGVFMLSNDKILSKKTFLDE